jgi:hypothetical protein
MKFLAILRDSLREALDAKVIYFLLGLSGLLVFLAFSLTFRPQPARKGVEAILARFPGANPGPFGGRPPVLNYDLEDFRQTDEASRPWEGEYRYDLVVTEAGASPPRTTDAEP